jgi:transcriptional regulator with XRE-family HTH domain
MPIFADQFRSLMDLPESPTQQELSDCSGVDRASISRYLSGVRFPVVEQLVRLVAAISSDRDIRLKLLVAYLQEVAEKCHAGFDDRHYTICAKDSPASGLGVDLELVAAEAARHPEVREMILALATLVRRAQEAEQEASALNLAIAEDRVAPAPKSS